MKVDTPPVMGAQKSQYDSEVSFESTHIEPPQEVCLQLLGQTLHQDCFISIVAIHEDRFLVQSAKALDGSVESICCQNPDGLGTIDGCQTAPVLVLSCAVESVFECFIC